MGLDGVELIMEIEKEFKMAIPESDAIDFDTVEKLVDYVHSRLRQQNDDTCPSQKAFYLVRRQLINKYGYSRSLIKIDTKIQDLIPATNREFEWREFVKPLIEKNTHIPSLVRPKWLNFMINFCIPMSVFFILIIYFLPAMSIGGVFLALWSALGLNILARLLTLSFKTEIPSKYSRVRDIVLLVSTLDTKTWTKGEVLNKIKQIGSKVLNIDPDLITPKSHWINDLGVG